MDAENTAVLPFEQRFRTCFGNMLVCKTPANAKLFAELNLPSFIRDWLIMRFSDQNGAIDQKKLTAYIKKTIPDKAQWNNMLVDMLYHNQTARFLAKVKIDFDMKKSRRCSRCLRFRCLPTRARQWWTGRSSRSTATSCCPPPTCGASSAFAASPTPRARTISLSWLILRPSVRIIST